MDFGNIPESLIDIPCICGWEGLLTIRECIEELNLDENIIHAKWKLKEEDHGDYLINFTAWTNNHVIFLLEGLSSKEQILTYIPRNPID